MAQNTIPALPAGNPTGPHTLPPLAYPFDALEPHIDAKTMEIHHGKHHGAYVLNLNKALVNQAELAKKSVTDLIRNLAAVPENIRAAVRNHGGGHANHALFWATLKDNHGAKPGGALIGAIEKKFKSYGGFQEEFTKAATTVFGSGWAWLSIDQNHELRVESTSNQDSPIMQGRTPLLGIDVWEHAYYLKYQNRRADYVSAFFNVIDWSAVSERFQHAGH